MSVEITYFDKKKKKRYTGSKGFILNIPINVT